MRRLFSTGSIVRAAHSRPYAPRTHTCGELGPEDDGNEVVLTGWLHSVRQASKFLSFFSLKDSYGTTQLVVKKERLTNPLKEEDKISQLIKTPLDSTLLVRGIVKARPADAQRNLGTGTVEVIVNDYLVLNSPSVDLPFSPNDVQIANEDVRSRFRYLDLRRDALSQNLRKRSKVTHSVRTQLVNEDFIEVETPLLLRSSPEGAREFLVPTRLPTSIQTNSSEHSPSTVTPLFYALSQSPQQAKQLIIASGGIDKYFQFARCFRDEDGRKDRQPEFTQVDLEMAFVSWGSPNNQDPPDRWRIGGREVKEIVERIIRKVMTYNEAMSKYGSDKPDLRFGLEVTDATEILPTSIRSQLEASGLTLDYFVIKATQPEFQTAVKSLTLEPNVALLSIVPQNLGNWWSQLPIISSYSSQLPSESPDNHSDVPLANVQVGDVVVFSLRKARLEGSSTELGRTRLRVATAANHVHDRKNPNFLWVTEFPLFTRADDDKNELHAHGRWSSSHHPFTAPMWEDIEMLMSGNVESVRGQHYDLVLNGMEIGGGSVRIHDADMQEFIFREVLQLTEAEQATFAHLVHALRCGAPPHGGIALGFDRLMAILCNTTSIKDVIAFPKTAGGTDPVFRSPSAVGDDILHKYGLMHRK
ncbi:hypothetical protein BS47DRAFT_1377942 [Hydnum rufescens UP504]|uniref:Aminoacyl-transfer RNA synthetases class-II family profile domain-containing protein n=1 Tax=Hydnum rufescens UP504 TaxID=1448309 RepID=A0A9P6AL48_9AGAM|nr:hypothetical protein BS47DRAFT_1377942 [Hydnum rufescens UP504]